MVLFQGKNIKNQYPLFNKIDNKNISALSKDYSDNKMKTTKLKLACAIFYQSFIFSPNDDLQKLWKMFFIASKKPFSFSRYSNFCNFPPPFPHFQDSKDKWKFMMSWTGLHKFTGVIFGITQKLRYIIPSNMVR